MLELHAYKYQSNSTPHCFSHYIVQPLFFTEKYGKNCSQNCRNLPGSFYCYCESGFTIDLDGVTCTPLVACGADKVCSHSCIKIDGEDTCTCNSGYKLNITDNSTCIDENECEEGTDNCDDDNGECTNTIGAFTCSCTEGYNLGLENNCNGKQYYLSKSSPNRFLKAVLHKRRFQNL